MKLTTVIVDTDAVACQKLQAMLKKDHPDCETVGIANSPVSGAALIRQMKPHMVLCEVTLLGGSGFEMLDLFPMRYFEVVMLSSQEDHALKAFEYGALDYLLKPVTPDKLARAAGKVFNAVKIHRNPGEDLKMRRFMSIKNDKIAIPTKRGYKLVPFEDIIRLEADGSYVTVHTRQSRPHLVSKTLKHYASELNSEVFMRVHRSHLINLMYVSEYCKTDGGYVIMQNGDRVDVASQKKEELLASLL